MKRLLFLGALLFTGFVVAAPIHNIVVFGDSLSDNGNLYSHMQEKLPPSPPYYEGRFSDGPVWVEYLGNLFFPKHSSSHMINYAFGGAKVSSEEVGDSPSFTLNGQVERYLAEYPDDEDIQNNLYVVWIGSNNYLGTPADPEHRLVLEVNNGIIQNLDLLASKGAKNFLILNLPDIGKTPFAAFLDDTSCTDSSKTCKSDVLTYFSKAHNEVLIQELDKLKIHHPNVNWIHFDLGQLFDEVMTNPAAFHLKYVDSACFTPKKKNFSKKSILETMTDVRLEPSKDCDEYLFFDLLHPTTFAHHIIARKVKEVLENANIDIK